MTQTNQRDRSEALLTTHGIFVVRLRADSDLGRRQIHGRIEHVMSGDSQLFADVAEMLDFMARQASQPTRPATDVSHPQTTTAAKGTQRQDDHREEKK